MLVRSLQDLKKCMLTVELGPNLPHSGHVVLVATGMCNEVEDIRPPPIANCRAEANLIMFNV